MHYESHCRHSTASAVEPVMVLSELLSELVEVFSFCRPFSPYHRSYFVLRAESSRESLTPPKRNHQARPLVKSGSRQERGTLVAISWNNRHHKASSLPLQHQSIISLFLQSFGTCALPTLYFPSYQPRLAQDQYSVVGYILLLVLKK